MDKQVLILVLVLDKQVLNPSLVLRKCVIWKALCPYILDARLGLWVSMEHTFTCVSTTNQAEWRSSATHLLAT